MRPLAPSTVSTYDRVLRRAFKGTDPNYWQVKDLEPAKAWTASSRDLLRAAIKHYYHAVGKPIPLEMLNSLPQEYRIQKETPIPSEEEACAFEAQAKRLTPGLRAIALLPLKLGLRAQELYQLPREAIQRAATQGELVITRKGGRQVTIKVGRLQALFEELLGTPGKPARFRADQPISEKERLARHPWKTVGEILSGPNSCPNAQYRAMWRLIRKVGESAGLTKLHPHSLRHAYATRMNRDGATAFTIQAALGHKSLRTTLRYVHPDSADIERYQRI